MKYYGVPAEVVPRMLELISRKEGFWLVVTGNSMTPTLKHLKDRVYISPFGGKVKKGDILLTAIQETHCLLHRVVKCNGDMVYYKGDAQIYCEGPLPVRDVIGIVTKIERNGKVIPVNNFYKLWSTVCRKALQLRYLIIGVLRRLRRLFSTTMRYNKHWMKE